jgi:hypothetical protein
MMNFNNNKYITKIHQFFKLMLTLPKSNMKIMCLSLIVISSLFVVTTVSLAYGIHPLPARVLSMESNSVGYFDIKYTTNYHNQTIKLGPMKIYDGNLTNPNPLNLPGLSIIPNRTSITLDRNSTIVEYAVVAGNNLKGIFALPLEECGLVPFVLGLDGSQINDTILEKFTTARWDCPESPSPITSELFSSRFIGPIIHHRGSGVMLVSVRTEKELYFPGDFLLIKGHVYMNITKVTVALEKNLRSIVHSMDSPVSKNGTFYANFTIPKDPDAVYWNIVTTAGGGTLVQGLPFKSASFSPFKQLKLGIVPVQVKCDYGLELVIKAEGGSPACVKPQTATILKERGLDKRVDLHQSTRGSSNILWQQYTHSKLWQHNYNCSISSSATALKIR